MALETSKVVLPTSVATYIKDNAKDTSTIAALSPSTRSSSRTPTPSSSTARARPRSWRRAR